MRLDLYLVKNNIVESRSKAQDYIKTGLVFVDNKIITKPKYDVGTNNLIKITSDNHFVSRAGTKLFNFLLGKNLTIKDNKVLDIGSSTGGFTDVVLKLGAKEVICVDVGTNQLAPKLRNDKRVKIFENTNILDFSIPNVDLILIDVSFTSIKPVLKHLSSFNKTIIALIKPQFETGKAHKGVLKDEKLILNIINDLKTYITLLGFKLQLIEKSTLKGKDGNQEYFFYIGDNKC